MKIQLAVVTLATLAAACSPDEPGRLPRAADPARVTVSSEQRAPALEWFAATVASERSAEIATRISGAVRAVPVDVGARVSRGDALIRLDDSDIAAQVAAARSRLELADRHHGRLRNLAADGAASQRELDQSAAALAAAEAAARSAEAQLAYAIVRAPFSGVIVARTVDPGDLAGPGAALLTLIATDDLAVVAELPAHRVGSVSVGQEISVDVDGVAGVLPAVVDRTVPALGSGSRTFTVEAKLTGAPAGVLPGAFARVGLMRPDIGPRWIPVDAVVERGQLRGVFAIEADTLRMRWLRLGQRAEGAVEVLAGPDGPLTVVRRPTPELYDGLAVENAQPEPWAPSGEREDIR